MKEYYVNGDTFCVNGETSDGYHTFDELYFHRMYLTAWIVSLIPHKCYKSKKHSDGTMFDGMFIVSINTEGGPITYHYDNCYWYLFKCKEVAKADEFDGHTSFDVLYRIDMELSKG